MRKFVHFSAAAAVLIAALAPCMDAEAASIQVAPLRIVLQPGRPVASLVVTNSSDSEISMQAEVMHWAQKDQRDVYAPTRDVLVNPVIFRIPANGRQIVRLGLQALAPAQEERSYRIFLRQLPQGKSPLQGNDGAAELHTLLQLVLPIFVPPPPPTGVPSVTWSLSTSGGSSPVLTIDNQGREHLQITQVTVRHADGRELLRQKMSVYVLPQQRARLPITLPSLPPDAPLLIEAQTDSKEPPPPARLQVPSAAATVPR